MTSKKLIIGLVVVAIVIICAIVLGLTRPVDIANSSEPSELQSSNTSYAILVSIVSATGNKVEVPMIEGFGTAQALWNTSLTAQVSGRVDHVNEKLLVGSHFEKGDVLAQLNDIDYQSLLASAKAVVAAANVNFLEQQHLTKQARERWQLSGLGGTPSELTLQIPQLQQAKAELEAAQAAVSKAQQDLKRTRITAPFNGRVASRSISPGSYVSDSTELAQVFATDNIEVEVALNEQQFSLLGDEQEALQRSVKLIDSADSQRSWNATIVRFQYQIDDSNRSRKLVLSVNNTQQTTDLLPGTFVKAFIPGEAQNDLLKLPASALSRDGYIWYVENGLLQRFRANTVYSNQDYILVRIPNKVDSTIALDIVRYPQSGFLPGQAVQVKAESES